MQLGRTQAARSDLKKSNQLLPNATATNALGEISLQKGDKETAKEYFRAVMNGSGSLADTAKQQFITLDIEQNPNSYIDVQTNIRDQQIILKVTNSTPLEISKLAITVRIESQGKSTEKTLLLTDLQGYESQFLQTGIRPNASVPIAIATRLKARL